MRVESGTYKFVLGCAVVYSIFVIYGSLVPLEFHSIPLKEALKQYWSLPYLQLGLQSRADWVANGLLFFPLSYLWMSFFVLNRSLSKNTTALLMIMVYIVGAAVAGGIEFIQLYFPQRTVSQNDIMAEFIGGGLGVTVWKFTYRRFLSWLDNWFQADNSNDKWRNLLFLYVAGIFLYSVMPLDLYLSPIEIYHKWKEGRLNLLPFATLSGDFLSITYEILSDILLWIPLAILTLLYKPRSYRRIWWTVLLVAAGIEFCQLFVFSRSTDITDVITAGIGAAIGLYCYHQFIAPHLEAEHISESRFSSKKSNVLFIGLGWVLVLLLVYWYPFNWQINHAELTARLDGFFSVPFETYYFTSEYNALTSLLQKVLFALPLGAWIGYMAHKGLKVSTRWLLTTAALGLFLILELGQILIPAKTANSTDLLLAWCGLFLGYKLMRLLSSTLKTISTAETPVQNNHVDQQENNQPVNNIAEQAYQPTIDNTLTIRNGWIIGLVIITLATILSWLLNLPSVPYNVKELVAGEFHWLRVVGMVLCGFWVFGLPLAVVLRQAQSSSQHSHHQVVKKRLPHRPEFWILLHTLIAWLLVRTVFPLESIYDIVGSPVWGWLPELEMLYRFVGLFLLFSVALLYSSSVLVRQRDTIRVRHLHMTLLLIIAMVIAYLVVIQFAATDNVVELFKYQGRSIYSLFIGLYFILLIYCGLALIRLWGFELKGRLLNIVIILLSAPLGYWLLHMGLESIILKYGKAFSAMQFLFSADREHYLPAQDLMVRFFIAHYVAIGFITATQTSLWLGLANRVGIKDENNINHRDAEFTEKEK